MRKITSFILALALTLSLLVIAGAAGNEVTLTVDASRNGNRVTYTVTMDASTNKVAALQFTLKPSGMTLASDADYHTEDYQNIFVDRQGEDSFGACGFTSSSGVYLAYGGNPAEESKIRYLTGKKPIMTITYTIDADAVAPALTVSDFKACESGTQAMENPYNCIYPQNPIAVPPASPTGVTVSGTAVSWNNTDNAMYLLYSSSTSDADIKAEWKNGSTYTATYVGTNGTIDNTTVDGKKMQEQSFTFTGVASGDYKLVIFKHGKYVPKIVPINVGASDYTCGQIKLWLYGDVTYDGKIRAGDAVQILRFAAELRTFTDDEKLAADVTLDGKIRAGDAVQIKRYAAELSSKLNTIK